MTQSRYKPVLVGLAFALLAGILWTLRSWNLEIGDGEFCCKQTVGEQAFAVTLSRSFLSYLLYRVLFFTLYPVLDWWIEDIIALSSCAAGLVFFYSLHRLACNRSDSKTDFWLLILFPSTTLLLQVFCGHIEFYPWTCALLMVSVWWSWESLHTRKSPLWASAALALSAGFHSSGVFYFPALLLLPILWHKEEHEPVSTGKEEWKRAGIALAVFLAAAFLHRKPMHWLYIILTLSGVAWQFWFAPASWRDAFSSWMKILLPWLFLFAVRAILRLRAEPLLEHIAPLGEPYDHGAYLYEFFSWDHLYDKAMFFLWLSPLGFIGLLGFSALSWRKIVTNRWLVFLLHFCLWTLVWYILFYPQLRTRDWDLFASVSIPLNLFAVYAAQKVWKSVSFRILASAAVVLHLCISAPIILKNSSLLTGRGYVEVEYAPRPVVTNAYIRGLPLGMTPLKQKNIRSGNANVRMIPLERGYQSWSQDTVLEPGRSYKFEPILEEIDNRISLPQEEESLE